MSSITGKVNSKAKLAGAVSPSSGAKNYEDLAGLPSINGVQVSGDKTSSDYGLKSGDFIVNFSRKEEDDGTYTYSADKTFQEVKNAYEQGRMLIGFSYSGKQLSLDTVVPSFSFMFSAWYPSGLRYETFSLMLTEQVIYTEGSMTALDQIFGGVKADPKTENDVIPARIGEDGKLYVSAKPKDFIVNGVVKGGQLTADKTNAEIYQAYQEGRTIKFVYSTMTAEIQGQVYETQAIFESYSPTTMSLSRIAIIKDELTLIIESVVPNKNKLGGIKANAATEKDTVPVNFNSKDGRAYASINVTEKTEADTDYTSEVKIDPETRKLYGKKDYLPGRSVYYWNDNREHTNDLGAIMAGFYHIGLVVGRTDVEGMTLPIFIIKGTSELGMVNFTGLDSSGNIYKGVYNLMNMEVSSLKKVTLGGS